MVLSKKILLSIIRHSLFILPICPLGLQLSFTHAAHPSSVIPSLLMLKISRPGVTEKAVKATIKGSGLQGMAHYGL